MFVRTQLHYTFLTVVGADRKLLIKKRILKLNFTKKGNSKEIISETRSDIIFEQFVNQKFRSLKENNACLNYNMNTNV